MSTLDTVKALVRKGDVRVTSHALDEAVNDNIEPDSLINSIFDTVLVEDYPNYWRGPCCLALHWVGGAAVHAVWGIPKGESSPAVLITTYRPDESKWVDPRTRRKENN